MRGKFHVPTILAAMSVFTLFYVLFFLWLVLLTQPVTLP